MTPLQKRIASVCALILCAAGLAERVTSVPEYSAGAGRRDAAQDTENLRTDAGEGEPFAPVVFWYTGAENRVFFETCAEDFTEETGIAVTLKEQPSLNYFSGLYEAVKTDTDAPDLYLLEADELRQAYLAQLLEKNAIPGRYRENWAKQAVKAASLGGCMYGYPLYFHTDMFAYRFDYFEQAPATVWEIIDYSVEHEPGEGVEKLLEWNLADGMCNFPFFGSAIQWEEEETGTIRWSYEKETYEACRTFFGNLTAAVELDETAISSGSVMADLKAGKTLAAFVDSDDMAEVCTENCRITGLPALNEELPMAPVSQTVVLCVNGMSANKRAAEAFAEYVSGGEMDKLAELTGHVPVKEEALTTPEQKLAYQQYETSVLEPNALNATDFWVKFQNEALEIWHGEE